MAIIGIALGIYTVSYHLTSYILDSNRFPFLGTIKYPFVHFSINNSIIPIFFLIIYTKNYVGFQLLDGEERGIDVFAQLLSFYTAFSLTVALFLLYFRNTNKDTFVTFAHDVDKKLKKKKITAVKVMKNLKDAKKKRYRIHSFITFKGGIKPVDQTIEYDKHQLMRIFDQHHLNAAAVEIVVFISIITLGFFKESPFFQIPAAASGLLLLSFFIMFTGAFSFWLRGWAISGMIILFFSINYLVKSGTIKTHNEAFGLNYNTEKAHYSLDAMENLHDSTLYQKDYNSTLKILENWRAKFPSNKKPKMVFLSASGGGQRAAVWTTKAIQTSDSILNGQLMNNSFLMTGASGGLIGLAYSREIYYREKQGENYSLHDPNNTTPISSDILNPMIFSMVVSDLFFPFQTFDTEDGQTYFKGRGYAFEHQLSQNTDSIMTKKVSDYRIPEQNAEIPMMILMPTIINDARKLYISPQNISYMGSPYGNVSEELGMQDRGVEFMRYFKDQNAENLQYLSALRMSATFPYITPNIILPSDKKMEVMDAGVTDNFGLQDGIRFLYVFREWIAENTSGVVFVNIRDTEKYSRMIKSENESIMSNLVNPIGNVFSNWANLQDFNNDLVMEKATTWFDGKIDYIRLEYIADKSDESSKFEKRASLSWHLTTKEKKDIEKSIYKEKNQKRLQRLKKLLNE